MSFNNTRMNRFAFIVVLLSFNNIKCTNPHRSWQPFYSPTYEEPVISTITEQNQPLAFSSNIVIGCEPQVQIVQCFPSSLCSAPPVIYPSPVTPHDPTGTVYIDQEEQVGLQNPAFKDDYLNIAEYSYFASIKIRKSKVYMYTHSQF